jgi:hypothetical protein
MSVQNRELQPEGGILHCNGPVAAQQESNESKDGQNEAWHVSRLFVFISFLHTDVILAKEWMTRGPCADGRKTGPYDTLNIRGKSPRSLQRPLKRRPRLVAYSTSRIPRSPS